jgi:arylsulfatase A-like enzyme
MVSAVDDGVGEVLAKLRELGIEENTMMVFLSDNGGPTSDNASDNRPLRGGKGSLTEGGIRVPFAAQWPGRIPKGLVYQHPVISLDILATIAALPRPRLIPPARWTA